MEEWNDGMMEWWNIGKQQELKAAEEWKNGIGELEEWNNGMVEYWETTKPKNRKQWE